MYMQATIMNSRFSEIWAPMRRLMGTIHAADVTLYPGDEAGGDPPMRTRLLAKRDHLLIANHRGSKTRC
jgi:hypothetical protein